MIAAGLTPTDAQRDALGANIEVAALDVLVNCAGMIRRGDEHDMDTFERA